MEVVQHHFRRAVEAYADDAGAGAGRGVGLHGVVLPGARAHVAGAIRIQGEGDTARQADLAAVGVAAEHQVEARVGRLAVDLRGVGEQDGNRMVMRLLGHLLQVVHPVVVGVVDTGHGDGRVPARQGHGFVEQHLHPHGFEPRHHADAVVVAQHAVHGLVESATDDLHGFQRRSDGAVGLGPVVTGEHAGIVFQPRHRLCHLLHGGRIEIGVEVGEMEQGVTLELGWQSRQLHPVVAHLDVESVAPATTVEAGDLQRIAHHGVERVPVLRVEEVEAAAEHLRIPFRLDAQALARMDLAEALLELFQDAVCHGFNDTEFGIASPGDFGRSMTGIRNRAAAFCSWSRRGSRRESIPASGLHSGRRGFRWRRCGAPSPGAGRGC